MRATPCRQPGAAAARQHARIRSRGVAAIEFAVVLAILMTLLAFPIFLGRVFMHYSVAQKAAHDAALILARIPLAEVRNEQFFKANIDVTKSIAEAELEELNPGGGNGVYVTVLCDENQCGPAVPAFVRVTVQMRMRDDVLYRFTSQLYGDEGMLITGEMTMPFIGK